ncbi:MAG: AtpZ/AtpI family protein [Lachnospiraceae bacterium]|nr:AtpZ/AtpI family protein [Lachnospiraceae bacterium]
MKRQGYNRSVYRSLALITQFGINMLVPVLLCMFAGIFLDDRLGTSFWAILLFFVGALAGFTNIFRMAKHIYQDKNNDGHDGNN